MGHMRFVVPCPDRLPPAALQRVVLCGLDGIPWRSHCKWLNEDPAAGPVEFVVERGVDESGTVCVPWLTDGRGELMLPTTSLMERKAAYNLSVELARGIVNRLRNHSADWEIAGLLVPERFRELLQDASLRFLECVTQPQAAGPAGAAADEVIRLGLEAGELLIATYTRQALAARHQQYPKLPTLLAARLSPLVPGGAGRPLAEALTAAAVGIPWKQVEGSAGKFDWSQVDREVEWSRTHGLRLIAGPLLQIDAASIPDWLYLWEDDFDQLQAYVGQYLRAVVERYRGRVQIWNCSGRMNVRGALDLSEEQKLRLVVAALEAIRSRDADTPFIVSFDQPWAEYLAGDDLDLSPLHFADSLVRAELGIAGIGLEVNFGYWPGGTLPRDLLEISRGLDRWSLLGVPLVVFLTIPSGHARPASARESPRLALPTFATDLDRQRQWCEQIVRLLLAKPYIQGVVYNQLGDVPAGEFAHAGLFDAEGQAKPALEALSAIRHQHLA